MRLFTAVDPSEEVQGKLAEALEQLRPAARVRWSRPDDLHLTLKFIGEYPDGKLAALEEALRGVEWNSGFDVRVRGLGFFPNERDPKVFWAGVDGGLELKDLAGRIDGAVAELGVPAERRLFSPHLTLARIEGKAEIGRLRKAIQALDSVEFGSFRADRFYLYRSQLAPGGAIYLRIGEFGTTS